MVSDSDLVTRLREILRSSDLETATPASVRRQLEAYFGVELTDKKAFVREQIDAVVESKPKEEEDCNGDENDEEGSENDEDKTERVNFLSFFASTLIFAIEGTADDPEKGKQKMEIDQAGTANDSEKGKQKTEVGQDNEKEDIFIKAEQ